MMDCIRVRKQTNKISDLDNAVTATLLAYSGSWDRRLAERQEHLSARKAIDLAERKGFEPAEPLTAPGFKGLQCKAQKLQSVTGVSLPRTATTRNRVPQPKLPVFSKNSKKRVKQKAAVC
jgi:hypothetical protein